MTGATPNKERADAMSTPPRTDSFEALQEEEPVHHLNEYPDGGSAAWLAVAGATACLFVSFGWVNVIGVFQEYYQANQLHNYTSSEIAWIPSLQSMCIYSLVVQSKPQH